jgi:hypothetical protein
MDVDPDSLRLPGTLPVVVPASPRRRSPPQHYLGGKPPMAWLSRAYTAGKAALANPEPPSGSNGAYRTAKTLPSGWIRRSAGRWG